MQSIQSNKESLKNESLQSYWDYYDEEDEEVRSVKKSLGTKELLKKSLDQSRIS